jgi:hypothetical protein
MHSGGGKRFGQVFLIEIRFAEAGPRKNEGTASNKTVNGKLHKHFGWLDLHPICKCAVCLGRVVTSRGINIFA